MNNLIIKGKGKDVIGTGLQGYLTASYADLVKVFGEPHINGTADGKVQGEWVFRTYNGDVFTIYDYKEYGTDVRDVTDWHIGGRKKAIVEYVKALFQVGLAEAAL